MHLHTFMNSSCCYSSSNSPSLRFFDLHTVRHFAVKISCLGNIILPFRYQAFPNVSWERNHANRKKFALFRGIASHYVHITITWTFSFSYIDCRRLWVGSLWISQYKHPRWCTPGKLRSRGRGTGMETGGTLPCLAKTRYVQRVVRCLHVWNWHFFKKNAPKNETYICIYTYMYIYMCVYCIHM